jgi:TPR repeat protein
MIQYHQFNANHGDANAQVRCMLMPLFSARVEWLTDCSCVRWQCTQATMGHIHLRGLHGAVADPERAHNFFNRAAEQGNAAALAYLGLMYDTGEGVTPNITLAKEYYEKAAAQVMCLT